MLEWKSHRLGLCCLILLGAVAGCGSDGVTAKKDSGTDSPGIEVGIATGGRGVGTGGQTGTGGDIGSGGGIGTGGSAGTGGGDTGGSAGTGGVGGGATGGVGGTRTGGAGGVATGGVGGARTGGAGGIATGGAGGVGTGGAGGAGISCVTAATCPAPAGGNGVAACPAGICTINCNTGYHRCGNVCALNTSTLSCGTTTTTASCTPCTVPQNGTATCDGTPLACGVNCTTGYHECGSTCVINGSTSVASCGNSCTVCQVPANGTPSCTAAGVCLPVCNAGYHLCTATNTCVQNNSPASGCSANGCTPCPVPANGSVLCNAGGMCVPSCNTGFHLCGTTCVANNSTSVTSCGNSCEVCTDPANGNPTCGGTPPTCGITCAATFHACPLANPTMCSPNNNVNSCGASCTPCAARANATVTCPAGACVYACAAGRHMCGNVCVLNDADATCGTVDGACSPCAAGLTCSSAGVCEVSTCAAGTHRCDSTPTVCQPNTSTTLCGTGNGTCVACPPPAVGSSTHAACTNGVCGTACDTGFCRTSPTAVCVSNTLATSCGAACTVCPGPTGTVANGVASCNTTGAEPVCDLACSPGFHKCGAACVADKDPAHCGASCSACNVTLPLNSPSQDCDVTAPPPSTTLVCTFTCAIGADAGSTFHRCGSACVVNSKYCIHAANPCSPCDGTTVCNAAGTLCVAP